MHYRLCLPMPKYYVPMTDPRIVCLSVEVIGKTLNNSANSFGMSRISLKSEEPLFDLIPPMFLPNNISLIMKHLREK